jgi:hypothetical protein
MVPTEVTPFVPVTLRGRFRETPYSKEGRSDTNFEKELGGETELLRFWES